MNQKKVIERTTSKQYGFLSLISLVVGIVIGSGIFFKNQSIYSTTNSAMLSMFAWFIISALVLFMIVGFIEIASSTSKQNKSGSVSNWSRNFLGQKSSKLIGYFFVYIYFPLMFVILSTALADQLLSGMVNAGYIDSSTSNTSAEYYLMSIVIGVSIFSIIALMNTFTNKPGKILSVAGTSIKLIPLLGVIIGMFLLIGGIGVSGESLSGSDAWSNVWDPNSDINEGMQETSTWSMMQLVILALPAVMFAFDGFILAASVQNEAKSKSTFKYALIFGLIFIVVIYLGTSLAVFTIAPTNEAGQYVFSIPMALQELFPEQSNWLPFTMSIFITFSILVGLSGTYIASIRNVSALSEKNYVLDKDGNHLVRNKSNASTSASSIMFFITLCWFIVLRGLDGLMLYMAYETSTLFLVSSCFVVTDFASSFVTLLAFLVYSALLFGLVVNKFTRRTEVEKTRFSGSASLISSILIFLMSLIWLWSILVYDSSEATNLLFYQAKYGTTIGIILMIFSVLAIVYWVNSMKLKNNLTKDVIDKKAKMSHTYNNALSVDVVKPKTFGDKIIDNIDINKYEVRNKILELDDNEFINTIKKNGPKL